jgi:flagellar motor switch protein FliG
MVYRPGMKLPKTADELDGTLKSAILLLLLDSDSAGKLLKELPTESVEEVTRALAALGDVPKELGEEVIREFYSLAMAQGYVREGGFAYAKNLLKNSLDSKIAEKVIQQIQTQVQKTPFSFLQKAESANLLTFIQDEHPQTIALIVSHLSHHKASEILIGLPPAKQIEVVRRIAHMEQTNPEVIREVEMSLESRLSNMISSSMEKVGGVETVAEILNLVDRSTERTIMQGVESEDPELVEEIRRRMFVFEDINMVNDKGIQAVLKEVENDQLVLALKTASDGLKNKILSNMSSRAAETIREDMEFMGPVRISDVEAAQQKIVDIVRRLEEAGEIIIAGRGGDNDVVSLRELERSTDVRHQVHTIETVLRRDIALRPQRPAPWRRAGAGARARRGGPACRRRQARGRARVQRIARIRLRAGQGRGLRDRSCRGARRRRGRRSGRGPCGA